MNLVGTAATILEEGSFDLDWCIAMPKVVDLGEHYLHTMYPMSILFFYSLSPNLLNRWIVAGVVPWQNTGLRCGDRTKRGFDSTGPLRWCLARLGEVLGKGLVNTIIMRRRMTVPLNWVQNLLGAKV